MGILSLLTKKKPRESAQVVAPDMSQPAQNLGFGGMNQPSPANIAQQTPMQMATDTANQIQNQPQQSLFSNYLDNRQNQLNDTWQQKKDMWDNSSGLMDYAMQAARQRMMNGNMRPMPQQPQLQAQSLQSLIPNNIPRYW